MPHRPPIFRKANPHTYDHDRGSARDRGYTTTWDKWARAYRKAHPLCLGCLAVGRTTVAELVDHIVPHRGDARLMWDQSNLQPLCRWHHDVIKQRLEQDYVAGLITTADLRCDSVMAKSLAHSLQYSHDA